MAKKKNKNSKNGSTQADSSKKCSFFGNGLLVLRHARCLQMLHIEKNTSLHAKEKGEEKREYYYYCGGKN